MAKSILPWFLSFLTGPYSSILPFAVLPWLSRFIVEWITSRINFNSLDLPSRARIAGLATCIPGIATLSLITFSIEYIPRITPGDFGCYMKLYGPVCMISILAVRSSVLWMMRFLRVRRLLASTVYPSGSLLQMAQEINLRVMELPVRVPVCMVIGATSPLVVVSTGMRDGFSDGELRAALWHEKGHIDRGDTRYNILISFLSECGIWQVRNAFSIYKQACEQLADQHAAKSVDSALLASVLIRFARRSWHFPFAEALAENDGLDQRVRSLLMGSTISPCNSGYYKALAMLVAACGCLAGYPKISLLIAHLLTHCI